MIRQCTMSDLDRMVEIAYEQNNKITHSSAFCSKKRESIKRDFEEVLSGEENFAAAYFHKVEMAGIITCYCDRDKNNVDCAGPFITELGDWVEDLDRKDIMMQLFYFIRNHYNNDMKYTFFFSKENEECIRFLELIKAKKLINEYQLIIHKTDYLAQFSNMDANVDLNRIGREYVVTDLSKGNYGQFIKLHDAIFPDVYVSGNDIIEDINKKRFVFPIVESDKIIAYSVLKVYENSKRATAEIIGVDAQYRRKGYGRTVISHLLSNAFQRFDMEFVDLIVDGDNDNAIALYLSLGFSIEAENCCYVV